MPRPLLRTLATPEATSHLATALAPLLRAGDSVLLSGPIGAGKTHFARAVIQSRLASVGRQEDVPSPTFTLVQVYDAVDVEIWHADLYRLSSAEDVLELGLDDAFEAAITLVEWPDRLGPEGPTEACQITFALAEEGRAVSIIWPDNRCAAWLAAFDEVI